MVWNVGSHDLLGEDSVRETPLGERVWAHVPETEDWARGFPGLWGSPLLRVPAPRPRSPSLLCPALATACVLCLSQGPGATRPTLAPLHSLQYELPISLARGWDRLGSVCLELALGCHLPVCTDPWDACCLLYTSDAADDWLVV